jgi:hypothetical protein
MENPGRARSAENTRPEFLRHGATVLLAEMRARSLSLASHPLMAAFPLRELPAFLLSAPMVCAGGAQFLNDTASTAPSL